MRVALHGWHPTYISIITPGGEYSRDGLMQIKLDMMINKMSLMQINRSWTLLWLSVSSVVQGIHKSMVWFQKLTRNLSPYTRAQRTPSAAATVQVSHALPAVRFSCLLRGRGASFQDGVAAGKGFLCALFWGVQICDYSAPCMMRLF